MTGAGSGTLAWSPEQSYLGGTGGTPTYYLPGKNPDVQTAELTRNILEILAPGDVETQKFLAQQLEGQLSLSWILTDDEYHRLVFNDSFTGFTSGLANSAEFYLGVDYIGGTTERQIKGFAPATCSIEYSGATDAVRVTLTGAYGDEEKNTSITPGTISEGSDEVPGHGASLTIGGTTLDDRLQSATLEFSNISRLIRGAKQKPVEAVNGDISESVTVTHIYDGPALYEQILGTSGVSTIQEDVDSVSATLSFDVEGSTVADYSIARLTPDTYDWQDLINNSADLTENVNYLGGGVTASDPTA